MTKLLDFNFSTCLLELALDRLSLLLGDTLLNGLGSTVDQRLGIAQRQTCDLLNDLDHLEFRLTCVFQDDIERRLLGGGSFAVSGEKGRIALTMNPNSGEIRFAVQDDHGTSAIKQAYPEEDLTGLAVATSALSAPTAIVTDQEIPLMIQILDSGDKTVSYSPEYFFHPEEY